MKKPKLSIIIPVYYNELNLPSLYEAIKSVILSKKELETELVFVDDGSQDESYSVLKKLNKGDKRVKIVKLARNHGSHVAILAGMNYATGDCVAMITADLQDPPEIVIEMYEKWKKGKKVVLAVREDREDGFIQSFFSNTYYKLFKKFALSNMPRGGFDCFLIDRKVVNILTQIQEKNSSLMGQILWTGFNPGVVYYTRRKREHGKSRWTFSKKIKYFIDSFVSFSYFPIKLVTGLGFLISVLGFIYSLVILFSKLNRGIVVEGWSSMMVVFLIVSGVQLLTVGLLGEYLWRNLDETRRRPIFIVEERVGFDKK